MRRGTVLDPLGRVGRSHDLHIYIYFVLVKLLIFENRKHKVLVQREKTTIEIHKTK